MLDLLAYERGAWFGGLIHLKEPVYQIRDPEKGYVDYSSMGIKRYVDTGLQEAEIRGM